MLILLPPSETKTAGGAGPVLDLARLYAPALTEARVRALAALEELAATPDRGVQALGLGPKAASEALHNAALRSSATMPAIERYTGVLFEALDAGSLAPDARAAAGRHVRVHSALFGLVGADDPIPAYRCSHDTKLPGLSLGALWRVPITAALQEYGPAVLDLRAKAYAALGPLPIERGYWTVNVLAPGKDGVVRALNHFNKRGKGLYTRALLEAVAAGHPLPTDLSDPGALISLSAHLGFTLREGKPGELDLILTEQQASPARRG